MQRCECDDKGSVSPIYSWLYDPETEWPFVNHAPGKCLCSHNIRLYERADGSRKWLCSCCNLSSDKLVNP